MANDRVTIDERAANTAAGAETESLQTAQGTQAAGAGTPAPKRNRGALVALAIAAVLAFAFCGWSLAQYVQGYDPIQIITGSAPTKTAVVQDGSASSADSTSSADSASTADSSSASSSASSESSDADSAATDDADQSSEGAAASSPSESTSDGGGAVAAGGGTQQGSSANASTISVGITIDATAAGSNVASGTVTIPAGGTAYDALMASGANVNARSSVYGMYVAAINGLAEKEHGSMSGWLCAVNGTDISVASDKVTLSDGDTVVWYYTAG